MSMATLSQVKELATDLSASEKIDLVQWLAVALRGDFVTSKPRHRKSSRLKDRRIDEVQINIQPKTGAEIVAMLESGEIDTSAWKEIDIPDPVVWLQELRRQERVQRGLEQ